MLRLLRHWLKFRTRDVISDDHNDPKAENTRVLIVRGLPKSASEQDIKNYISLYCTVLQVMNLWMNIDDERVSLVKLLDPVDSRRLYELSKTEYGLHIHGKRIKLETLKDTEEAVIVWKKPENERNINNYLNDTCLSEIFRHLPLESLASAAHVCQRWHNVAQKTAENNLEVEHLCLPDTISISEQLLSTFGERMISLKLTLSDFKNTKTILISVQKYCKNLKNFSLRHEDVSHTTLADNRMDYKEADKTLSKLLSELQQLESLKLTDLNMISGKSLSTVHENLQSLHLENCCMLRGNEIGSNARNIQRLALTSNTVLTDEEIEPLIRNKPFLSDITLSGCFPNIFGFVYEQVANMGNQLIHIDLSYNTSLILPQVEKILDNCHNLESVNVSGLDISTYNDGMLLMEKLGSKMHIKKVAINSLIIPDQSFLALPPCPNLREIECRANPNFTNKAFAHFIAMCNNLNVFDVRDNFCLSNNCLLTFMQYPRIQPLKLFLGGSYIFEIEPWMYFHNVEYVTTNNCENIVLL